MTTDDEPCRCGRQTADSHPCHYGGYTCPNEGTRRLYVDPRMRFSLAGAQMKLSAHETVACDEHWAEHSARLAEMAAEATP